jgi:hypothetical protein
MADTTIQRGSLLGVGVTSRSRCDRDPAGRNAGVIALPNEGA